jgi:hypothetical protein
MSTMIDDQIKATLVSIRAQGCDENVSIGISTNQYKPDRPFTITYKVSIGSYPHAKDGEADNLLDATRLAMNSFREHNLVRPREHYLALEAPKPDMNDEIEEAKSYTDFSPVPDDDDPVEFA